MRFVIRPAALLATIAALFSAPVFAEKKTFDARSFTCPIGGKSFTHDVGYSAFPLITMPDGSWLGDTEIGVQIPVCPDNGLVLLPDLSKQDGENDRLYYVDYSAAEKARLPALIADPEYQALKADGPYAQAYWLATKLGRPGEDRFFMLQRATWATRDPVVRKRLVGRLAADGEAVVATDKAPESAKRFHLVYVASALREMGRFDEATALLDRIEKGGPPVLEPQDPDSIFGPDEFAPQLRLAIAEKDDGRFPAEMLPQKMMADICEGKLAIVYGPTLPATKAACKIRREREAKESRDLDTEFSEARQWNEKPAERDKACAATPGTQRSRGLQRACNEAQDVRDQIASLDLGKSPETLAANCAATPGRDQRGPLYHACRDFASAIGDQLGALLAKDDPAFTLFCVFQSGDPDVGPPDRSELARDGCWKAKMARRANAADALTADLPALDKRCADYGERYDDEALTDACRDRAQLLMEKDARRLFDDKAAFDQDCGQFRAKMKDGWISEGEKERACRSAWELRTGRVTRLPNEPALQDEGNSKEKTASEDSPSGGDPTMTLIMRRMDTTKANAPLQAVARAQAAALIATAKASGTYPKRKPGDRE